MTPKLEVPMQQVDYVHLGEMLRDSRMGLGWNVDHVAQTLRIRGDWVVALEKGDFSVFPGQVYAKGYLSNYMRLLGVESLLEHPPMKEVVGAHAVPTASHYTISAAHAIGQVAGANTIYKKSVATIALPHENRHRPAVRGSQGVLSVSSLLISVCIAVAVFFVVWMVQERMNEPVPVVSEVRQMPQHMNDYMQTGLPSELEMDVDMGTLLQPTPVASCSVSASYQNWPPCYDRALMLKEQEGFGLMRLTHPLAVILGK